MNDEKSVDKWLSVIGRALAFLCINSTDLREKGMTGKARFLRSLGLSSKDAAALLETSEGSIGGLVSYAGKSMQK